MPALTHNRVNNGFNGGPRLSNVSTGIIFRRTAGTVNADATRSKALVVGSVGAKSRFVQRAIKKQYCTVCQNQMGWNQLGEDISGDANNEFFGISVSLSSDGNTVAIGAPGDIDGEGAADPPTGYVRVYRRTGTEWNQLGEDIDGEAANEFFGISVSLSSNGNRVAIGAPGTVPGDDGGGDSGIGRVRVYSWTGSAWQIIGGNIDGHTSNQNFGQFLSLSSDGNRLAIGAVYNGAAGSDSVAVYEYNEDLVDQAEWEKLQEFFFDRLLGGDVSLSYYGNYVAIGEPYNDTNSISGDSKHGHVIVYQYDGSNFTEFGHIYGDDYDELGSSVSLSSDGKRLAIGAPITDPAQGLGGPGHVRVYEYNGSQWEILGQNIPGENNNDRFGFSVSLSSDGSRVAIGAPYNDGNGDNSGHVRVYKYNGSQWEIDGEDIDGEEIDDVSGYSVSLSSDGNRVAVGALAQLSDNSGHVRVYQYN